MGRLSEAYAIVANRSGLEAELIVVSRYMTLDAGHVDASTEGIRKIIVSSVDLSHCTPFS